MPFINDGGVWRQTTKTRLVTTNPDDASNSTWLSGGSTWRNFPYDLHIEAFGPDVTRFAGTGDFPFGLLIPRDVTLTSVTYRCYTADGSGVSTFELHLDGVAVPGTEATAEVSSQVNGVTATGTWSVAAGQIITLYIMSVGDSPGNGLVADIAGLLV